MPDIAMCSGIKEIKDEQVKCKQRKTCVRCISTPSEYQSYFSVPPFVIYEDKHTDCEYYWNINCRGKD